MLDGPTANSPNATHRRVYRVNALTIRVLFDSGCEDQLGFTWCDGFMSNPANGLRGATKLVTS